jgi:starch synthase (maltosyl-transferring)
MPDNLDVQKLDRETGPVSATPATGSVGAAEKRDLTILRAHGAAEAAAAHAIGFNFLLLSDAGQAATGGTETLLDIDLTAAVHDDALLQHNPDWFVHGPQGPTFRFLADTDATVGWWRQKILDALEAGFAGFYCRAAHHIPAGVWTSLIEAARAQRTDALFIADILGATPGEVARLQGAGFSLATSSSCYWNFSAGWLNEDTARAATIAPPLSLAGAPGGGPLRGNEARRAIRFAAAFGTGWLLDTAICPLSDDINLEIAAVNALRAANPALRATEPATLRSSPGGGLALLARGDDFLIAVNATAAPAQAQAATLLPQLGLSGLQDIDEAATLTPADALSLPPAAVKFFRPASRPPVCLPLAPKLDCDAPRIAIEAITPQVDDGSFPVRRTVGDLVTVEADFIADGHDKLAGEVLVRAADATEWRAYPLALVANDRWRAQFPLERMGRHMFVVTAWKDAYATFVDELTKKQNAGVPIHLELREGIELVEAAAHGHAGLSELLTALRAETPDAQYERFISPATATLMRAAAPRKFLVRSHEIILDAERLKSSFASWYEIFPRSQSGDPNRHGTLRDVIAQLPRIAGMGFDVLYFPPIHPIGAKNRKGRNNTVTPAPTDPGSPYAIGSADGGHDALHPELGTLEDFRALVAAANAHGLELALDFAIQCAPDHPWLQTHKDWFDWRPDGSLRYAENPPKKYEDIVNVDFYTDGAKPALWLALRDAVQFWVDQGVKIFRVDNPHTKPFPFWEWLIADIRSRHPDTMFLAEAFTRPKVMYRLAKIGFSQSYTYFTWRNTKAELEEYLTELSTTAPKDFFRPHFFVNTPDINPVFLQTSGRAGFLIRAALGATLSGLWGVYNGFELCEATPVAPGKEEYLNSEKYEIRAWDYDRPGNITADITALNRIRKANAALHSHVNVEFLPCDNPNVIYFRKFAADGNTLLVAISLDPHAIQDTVIELPLWRFGIPDDGRLAAEDLLRGDAFIWSGKYQPVRLNPSEQPFCIWRVAPVTP